MSYPKTLRRTRILRKSIKNSFRKSTRVSGKTVWYMLASNGNHIPRSVAANCKLPWQRGSSARPADPRSKQCPCGRPRDHGAPGVRSKNYPMVPRKIQLQSTMTGSISKSKIPTFNDPGILRITYTTPAELEIRARPGADGSPGSAGAAGQRSVASRK